MATNGLRHTLDRLRKALAPDLPDEHLLRDFIAERDEAAFAALVRRHGQMVLGVSRRVLGNLHDSEDVFQATFLVLAQKARSVLKGEAVASWLYKVAYRIALKARARNDRRQQRERQAAMAPQTSATALQDWEVLLDEELNRLPEKYRLPVILCDLEGRTRKEVERALRLAPGTLSSRLTTARRMLAERLTRRGLTVSAGALATMISTTTVSASLPPGLAGSTAKTAVLVAAGKLTVVSSSVLSLMKIGAKAMFLAKLKATLATVVVLAFVGGGIVYSGGGPAQPKNELEALRRENELLRVNLRVTLEKIESLEKQVTAFKGEANKKAETATGTRFLAEAIYGAQKENAQAQAANAARAAAAQALNAQKLADDLSQWHFERSLGVRKTQTGQNDKDARLRVLDGLEKALKELRDLERSEQKSNDSKKQGGTSAGLEAVEKALNYLRKYDEKKKH